MLRASETSEELRARACEGEQPFRAKRTSHWRDIIHEANKEEWIKILVKTGLKEKEIVNIRKIKNRNKQILEAARLCKKRIGFVRFDMLSMIVGRFLNKELHLKEIIDKL